MPKNDQAEQKQAEQNDKPNGLDAAALQRQLVEMQETMKLLQARIDLQGGKTVPAKEVVLTEENGQYVATARGHIPGIGIIEPGVAIPAGIPISDNWMKKAPKRKKSEEDDEGEE